MNEIRCVGCGKKLAEAALVCGTVKITCRCGVKNTVTAEMPEETPIRVETAEYTRTNIGGYSSKLHNTLEKK